MLFQSGISFGHVGQRAARRLGTACFALLLAAPVLPAAAGKEPTNWTVLTVARNGAWGIATAPTQGEAIAGAVFRCQAMTADESDCGAELVAFKTGLAVALLCGDHRVIVTANDSRKRTDSLSRSTCPAEGGLWLRLSGVPALAANRRPWRSHNLQSRSSTRGSDALPTSSDQGRSRRGGGLQVPRNKSLSAP